MSRNLAVFGLSDDLDAPVGCEHLLQAQAELGVVLCQHHSHGGPSHVGRLASALHATVHLLLPRERHGPKVANTVRERGWRSKDSWSRSAIIRQRQSLATKRAYKEGSRGPRRRRCLPAEVG